MDQPGPEFFMNSYCGSGRSQGRIIFLCQTGLAAGAAPPDPGCQGSSRGAIAVEVLCGKGMFCQTILSEKNCVKFYFQGRIVSP
jgi:hypothetical protein